MSPFPLRGTWTGEAIIHQFPLPIPPSLFLSQNFYFTPPSTFTLKFELLTQPPFVLLVESSVFQNSPLFLPISLRRSLPFYPSVLTLGSVLEYHVLLFSSAGLPVFPAIPFLPSFHFGLELIRVRGSSIISAWSVAFPTSANT